MGSLEHAEKSLVVFRGCVYEVPNGNVYPNLLKLGGSAVVGTGDWPDGGGTTGSGRLGLTTSAVGL